MHLSTGIIITIIIATAMITILAVCYGLMREELSRDKLLEAILDIIILAVLIVYWLF